MIKNFLLFVALLCVYPVWSSGSESNRAIVASLVEEVLESAPEGLSPADRAHVLVEHLDYIGSESLARGFRMDAYPARPNFYADRLWEGGELPLTLMVFVWPPQKWALSCSPEAVYRTCIHGHPVLCSLTVLTGSVIQDSFELVDPASRRVCLLETERLLPGDLVIDEKGSPFIHRIYCADPGDSPALTLHGYGAGSREAVREAYSNRSAFVGFVESLGADA